MRKQSLLLLYSKTHTHTHTHGEMWLQKVCVVTHQMKVFSECLVGGHNSSLSLQIPSQ